MKRRITGFIAVVISLAVVGGMLPTAWGVDNLITSGFGPQPNETAEKWTAPVGEGELTPPIVVGNAVVTASADKLYLTDKEDGEEKGSYSFQGGQLVSTQYALTEENNLVFAALDDGSIEAIDISNTESPKMVWRASEDAEGNPIGVIDGPITYDNNKLYAGSNDGNYSCLSAATGDVLWQTRIRGEIAEASSRGCYVGANYVVISDTSGKLYSLSVRDGSVADSTDAVDSPLATDIIKEDDAMYFVTEGGSLYRFTLNNGTFGAPAVCNLGAEVSGNPTVYQNRVYIGVGNGNGYNLLMLKYNGNSFDQQVQTLGTSGLPSTVLAAEESSNKVRLYFTVNEETGSVFTAFDDGGELSSDSEFALFTPKKDERAVASGQMAMDDNVLYYSNAQGYVFALHEGQNEPAEPDDPGDSDEPDDPEDDNPPESTNPDISITSAERNVKDPSQVNVLFTLSKSGAYNCYYQFSDKKPSDIFSSGKKAVANNNGSDLTQGIRLEGVSDDAKKLWLAVIDPQGNKSEAVSKEIPQVHTVTFTVDPKAKLKVMYRGEAGSTTIFDEKVSSKKIKMIEGYRYSYTASKSGYRDYSGEITVKKDEKVAISLISDECKLERLSVSTSAQQTSSGFLLTPTFDPSTSKYTAETDLEPKEVYLWVRPKDERAKCNVYAVSGVDGVSSKKSALRKETANGYSRFTVKLQTGKLTAKVKIVVEAESGKQHTYSLTIKRSDKTPPTLKCTSAKRMYRVENGKRTLITQIKLQCNEKATGYLKVVNSGVVPSSFTEGAVTFKVKKGETTLNIKGLATAARDLYIVAADKAGNFSSKIKISVPALNTATTPNTNGTTTGGTNSSPWWRRLLPGSNRTTQDGTTTGDTENGTSAGTNAGGLLGGMTSGTQAGTGTSSGLFGSLQSGDMTEVNLADTLVDAPEDWNSSGDPNALYIDLQEDDQPEAEGSAVTSSDSANGAVPNNSVLSRGMPTWGILLIIVLICGGGFALYWFILHRRQLLTESISDDEFDDEHEVDEEE